jgi:hypothetical protein
LHRIFSRKISKQKVSSSAVLTYKTQKKERKLETPTSIREVILRLITTVQQYFLGVQRRNLKSRALRLTLDFLHLIFLPVIVLQFLPAFQASDAPSSGRHPTIEGAKAMGGHMARAAAPKAFALFSSGLDHLFRDSLDGLFNGGEPRFDARWVRVSGLGGSEANCHRLRPVGKVRRARGWSRGRACIPSRFCAISRPRRLLTVLTGPIFQVSTRLEHVGLKLLVGVRPFVELQPSSQCWVDRREQHFPVGHPGNSCSPAENVPTDEEDVDILALGEGLQLAVGGVGLVFVRETGSEFVHEARPVVRGQASFHAVHPILVTLQRLFL